MRVLIAPNAMKGSLNAIDFADAIEKGLNKSGIRMIDKIPLADGGDGTGRILAEVMNADFIPVKSVDPLGRKIESGFYLNDKKVAIVEMAAASGLQLLKKSEYSAAHTSTYGTGLLIRSAIEHGAQKILLGVGGSATVDAGMGALMALGVRFYNRATLIEKGCGAQTGNVTFMETRDAEALLKDIRLEILSDVDVPLLGNNGAVAMFATQKGANPEEKKILNRNLALFAGALFQKTGKLVDSIPYGGAAGGVAASLNALFDARLVDGASFILERSGFYALAHVADVIITGEGKVDETTLNGKAPGAVVQFGTIIDKPVYAVCGVNELKDLKGFQDIIPLTKKNKCLKLAMNNSYPMVVTIAESLGNKLIVKYNE